MRAYLIKEEGEFERLALEKYQEDEQNSIGTGSINNLNAKIKKSKKGKKGKKKGGSYNNSSDEGSNLSL